MMKRILCALLALLTVLILPSCSNNEAPEQMDEKENVSVVTPREEPLNRTEKLEELFYHKITGEEIGRVDITVDYDYNFAEAKINDCKTETEQKEGYKVTVTKEINGSTVTLNMVCEGANGEEYLDERVIEITANADGSMDNRHIFE